MTVTDLSSRQLHALAELLDAWRANRRRPLAVSIVSAAAAFGAEAGHLAFNFVGAVLEEGGWSADIATHFDVEAGRAIREGLSGYPLSLSRAYADVLHGFAEAVRAIK